MATYAISAIGDDRRGILQALTAVLVAHDANIEDSQMTILRGHFAMVMVVGTPKESDAESLREDLEVVADEVGLEALTLGEVQPLASKHPDPTHMVTVYGADKPGIVHAIASGLAEQGCSITDLNTRIGAEYEDPNSDSLLVLMAEAIVPDGRLEHVEAAMAQAAKAQGVEVDLHALENA